MRTGIPSIGEVETLKREPMYKEHMVFNREFLSANENLISRYRMRWGADPLKLWSRRWEYPFASSAIFAFAETQGQAALHILDAGSGVTYLPFLLCSRLRRATVTCCDTNPAYEKLFVRINRATAQDRVRFVHGTVQSLPLESGGVDVVCCISVLEHTTDYDTILDEFRRVLRPGGLLVLTFDLSLDGRFELPREAAARLLSTIEKRFDLPDDVDLAEELEASGRNDTILSTDHVRKTAPELLPWRFRPLIAVRDLINGKGWTGGFRSKSVFCLQARSPST